jgi:hypothetical protein
MQQFRLRFRLHIRFHASSSDPHCILLHAQATIRPGGVEIRCQAEGGDAVAA